MNRYIAVFDSGVGGISVLNQLIRLMPQEHFLYFGDTGNAPYGSRTTTQVRTLTLEAAEKLMARDCKALVVACNTATSAAITALREEYPDKVVVGIEPALKPAVEQFPAGRIGIMATPVTLREEKLANQLARFPQARIHLIPAPGLVELIEEGKPTKEYLHPLLYRYKGKLDALVLGCTHYPFASQTLRELLPGTLLLDGGEGTARQTRRLLQQQGLLRTGTGSLTILNPTPRMMELVETNTEILEDTL